MAEDTRPTEGAVAEESSRSIVFTIAIAAAIIIVPTIMAFVTYRFATQRMADPSTAGNVPTVANDRIPDSVQTIQFDQQYTAVLRESEEYPASTFAFKVAFDVTSPQAVATIDRHRARFHAMIIEVHSFRSRAELEDPLVKQSIQRNIRDRANELLRRLGATDRDRVLDVFHEQYVVQD